MRSTKVLLVSEITLFAIFFFDAFIHLDLTAELSGRAALGTFEIFGAFASIYLLSNGRAATTSLVDWLGCGLALLLACLDFAGSSITLFALYLFFRDRDDLNTRAAGIVAAAVAVQAIWAPLIFSKVAFLLLQIDAGITGWLVSQLVPGATWSGTIVYTPSGHNVAITAPCASFHNLSLATLCWVTLTMLHRPYWVKGDLYIGLGAALIQFVFNVWRLVFVCLSLPMYDFWHEGLGKHIFSAVATACAIIFVQLSLIRRDQRNRQQIAATVGRTN
jgi:hypothetical protein